MAAASRRAQSRISASCFRALSLQANYYPLGAHPDSIISSPEFSFDPSIRHARKAGQHPIAFA
jgi:hypothetical protein